MQFRCMVHLTPQLLQFLTFSVVVKWQAINWGGERSYNIDDWASLNTEIIFQNSSFRVSFPHQGPLKIRIKTVCIHWRHWMCRVNKRRVLPEPRKSCNFKVNISSTEKPEETLISFQEEIKSNNMLQLYLTWCLKMFWGYNSQKYPG